MLVKEVCCKYAHARSPLRMYSVPSRSKSKTLQYSIHLLEDLRIIDGCQCFNLLSFVQLLHWDPKSNLFKGPSFGDTICVSRSRCNLSRFDTFGTQLVQTCRQLPHKLGLYLGDEVQLGIALAMHHDTFTHLKLGKFCRWTLKLVVSVVNGHMIHNCLRLSGLPIGLIFVYS